jgi:hypothetical protein
MEMIRRWFRKLFVLRCSMCQALPSEVGWIRDPHYPPNDPNSRFIRCPKCSK